ncbi:hypothetical protein D0Z08_23600 [Nocardioides immobilis]|uniref:Uncharacterized protein n=1 Tax=Nocardioides immobilis TaxID=2049295 RepID=A0A417XX28_9ACTN|nr:hypothetical protein [Nocardioides immobilis]RHW24707.1 hypothetical protein D0Z08_23600 [Nocardioides immobilis]
MRRAVLTILAALLVLGGAATPAGAESGSLDHPSGDAPAKIDLTRLSVENGNRWFTMRVDVRNLRQKGKFNFHYWGGTASPPARSVLIIVHRVDGETRARFLSCGREDCAPDPCARMRVAWRSADDFIRVSAPQRCFPRPRNDPDAPAPAMGRFFAWSRLGDGASDTAGGLLALQRG